MDNLKRYKQINKGKTQVYRTVQTYIPTPDKSDYVKGYLTRIFVQKSNDNGSPIYEVNQSQIAYFSQSPLYSVAIVKWRISGPNESFLKEGIMYKSVKESNRISIKLHLDKIPNLELYLPNLLQFYKS
tara:strand:+ start:364 stop:747 length:384 start_codon:yes stop_codon:yes gene_type:complete